MDARADRSLAAARGVYRCLTLVYPRPYRRAYCLLMEQLFCDQYRSARADPHPGAQVRFWWRALTDLASSALREGIDYLGRFKMDKERAGGVALGLLIFVLLGTGVALAEAPIYPDKFSWVNMVGAGLWLGGYLVVLGVLLKGWLAGFPRWVYPSLGYAVLFPLYLANASTPGISIFGIQIWGRELWGWRAFVPLGAVVLLALVLSRPLWGNLARLARSAWDEWTVLSFALFGLMPFAVFVTMDEVEHSFSFWPIMVGLVVIIMGAFLYMRLGDWMPRILGLLGSAFLAVVIMGASGEYYWKTHYVNFTTGEHYLLQTTVDWGAILSKAATMGAIVVLFLLIPAVLGLVHKGYDRLGA
jgi:hypothetical protein